MRRIGLAQTTLVLLTSLVATADAMAGPNDFRLNASTPDGGILFAEQGNNFASRDDQWQALVGELAYVFAPRLATPAETLGHAGFHTGILWSGTFISNDENYWRVTERAQDGGTPVGVLQTLQLDVRKGLPFSFEVGVNLVWLVKSELFAPGLEVRWAIHEGFDLAPDLGLRGSVSHVVGNRDLNMTVIGLDAVLSRSFGVAGMVNIGPYVSYSLLMVAASSRVLDPTPTDAADVGKNLILPSINPSDGLQHKLTVGSRFLFSLFNLSVQSEIEMFRDEPGGKTKAFGPVFTLSAKLGLDY